MVSAGALGPQCRALRSGYADIFCRFHYALKSTQLTNLLFLARAMCVNLSSSGLGPTQDDSSYANMDNLRAYAGTYYLNTL